MLHELVHWTGADHRLARTFGKRFTAIDLQREGYSTHSMRCTKAAMVYRKTRNLRTVQILLGQSKIENTVRYLGGDIEDALVFGGAHRDLSMLAAIRRAPMAAFVEVRRLLKRQQGGGKRIRARFAEDQICLFGMYINATFD